MIRRFLRWFRERRENRERERQESRERKRRYEELCRIFGIPRED